ncbi:unnamed protein product [Heligmosomoides polygyrus]|uniref:Uncharacterized protein n=1 Tax=Heligmosomoides polygyrus TaxID=6339 RepID=A0A3P7XVD6_HELPZ|nr:unnamed protein product [Heligmosomoides polygyrus]
MGLLDLEADSVQENVEEQPSKAYNIGPLPMLIDTDAEVPLLAPPPRAPPSHTPTSVNRPFPHLENASDPSGYSVQDLFPLVQQPKPNPNQGGIIDLLSAPSSQFPNPFDESKTTEWDLLLSQCDIQQSNDLI